MKVKSLILVFFIFQVKIDFTFSQNLCDNLAMKRLFEIFKLKYGRRFATSTLEEKYFQRFCEVVNACNAHNEEFKAGRSSFMVDWWMNSDLPENEFNKNLMGYRARPQARSINGAEFTPTNATFLNYTATVHVTPVGYQKFCGCCWAFAATGALEGQLKKKTGALVKLSEQNLIDCNYDDWDGNWGCDGGYMQTAYDYLKYSQGLNPASSYLFTASLGLTCKFNSSNALGKVNDYVQVTSGNETLLKNALFEVGPLAVAVDASLVSFQNYKTGIYDDLRCTSMPNHAVLLVGFGTDPVNGKYWLIKNSWGTTWGERGYMRLARDKNDLCQITFDASCPLL